MIEDRKSQQRKYNETIAEWQTRTLAQFIAATVPQQKKGQKNPLAEEAAKIRLEFKGDKSSRKSSSDDERSLEDIIENGSKVAENAPGSYERLMRGFRT